MGIDFGGESIKVSIVTTRKPQETVLDRDSSRKTTSMLGFKDCFLVFSESARSVYRRSPELIVKNIDHLLGKSFDDPTVTKYRQNNPHLMLLKNQTDNSILVHFEKCNYTFTPVELFSIWLNEIRGYTAAFSQYDIADVLLTFDPIVDQAKSHAILSASLISKINLMEITDTSRTLATQFMLSRKSHLKDTPQNIMFLDVGSLSTVVTLTKIGLIILGENKTIPSYNITGIGYHRVGGNDFDLVIKEHLMDEFIKKHKIKDDIKNLHKTSLKFEEAAKSAKRVLSASKETRISVDDAYNYITFSHTLSRSEFKEISSHLLQKILTAIDRALASSKISESDVDEVIIMGGGSLIYIIQEAIKAKMGKDVSRVLNTDESNAAGASLLAAKAHKFFRVADFQSPSYVYYPVEIEYSAPVNNSDGQFEVRHRIDLLYPHLSKFTAKKILTIHNVTGDFSIDVRYVKQTENLFVDELDYHDIFQVNITGIPELIQKQGNVIPLYVGVHFRFDPRLILTVSKVEYWFKKNSTTGIFGKMGKAVMDIFGLGGNSTEKIDQNNSANEQLNASEATVNETVQPPPPPPQPTPKADNYSVSLTYTVIYSYPLPPDDDSIKNSQNKLNELYQRERERNDNIKAKSDIEGAIFDSETKIAELQYREYATDDEWKSIVNVTNEVKTWYDLEGYSSTTLSLRSKLVELQNIYRPIHDRLKEEEDLKTIISTIVDVANRTQQHIFTMIGNPNFTEFINSTFALEIINSSLQISQELQENYTEQLKLKPTDPRIITSQDVRNKIQQIELLNNQFFKQFQKNLNKKNAEKAKKTDPSPEQVAPPSNETELPPEIPEQKVSEADAENIPIPEVLSDSAKETNENVDL